MERDQQTQCLMYSFINDKEHTRFTEKLMTLNIQDTVLAQGPSMALGGTRSAFTFSCFYIKYKSKLKKTSGSVHCYLPLQQDIPKVCGTWSRLQTEGPFAFLLQACSHNVRVLSTYVPPTPTYELHLHYAHLRSANTAPS